GSTYFVRLSGRCLTYKHPNTSTVFRIYRETLSRFSCPLHRHVTYPSIYDPAMRTLIAFGGKYPTSVIPSTLVLDRQHRVAAVFLRELLAADLQPVVERVAEEEPSGRAPVGAQ
ncbi:hypothetical protein ABLN72_04790, partial [Mycobacterium tuberculosis]